MKGFGFRAIGLVMMVAGCGSHVTTLPTQTVQRQVASPTQMGSRTVGAGQAAPGPTAGSTAGANDPSNIANNPFVSWVKKTYPKTASTIITQYLSKSGTLDAQRLALQQQVLDQAATQLTTEVNKSLPPGLQAAREGNVTRVSGITDYQGHSIELRFEFLVQLLPSGVLQISVPATSVYAAVSGFDPLAEWFGGDIKAKAQAEISRQLDLAGPINMQKMKGLTYRSGGTFLVDPGVVFVTM